MIATAFESDDGFFSFSYVRIMYTAFSEVCPPKSAASSGSMNVTARFTVSESTVAGGSVASSTGFEGALAAEFAAIGCSLFATLDYPSKQIFGAIAGIVLALPLAAAYEFAILPRIDGFTLLALVLAPVVVLFGLRPHVQLAGSGRRRFIAWKKTKSVFHNRASLGA